MRSTKTSQTSPISPASSKYRSSKDRSDENKNTLNGSPASPYLYSGQFTWHTLYSQLRESVSLQQLLHDNLSLLLVSKQRFDQTKDKHPVLQDVVNKYQSRNCLKALSATRDLSSVKINQYKFLYEGFTLGVAIKLLLKESVFLFKSLQKRDNPMKELRRLVTHWLDYLIVIHRIPEPVQAAFRKTVLDSIELSLPENPLQD